MKILKAIALLISFFLIIPVHGCKKSYKSGETGLPDEKFIDAVLSRDTLTILRYIDTLSFSFIDKYSVPVIRDLKDVHYRLVVSVSKTYENRPMFTYTVVFPWKEKFAFSLVPYEGKWSFPVAASLHRHFRRLNRKNIIYYYPEELSGDKVETYHFVLSRFVKSVCSECKGCCNSDLIYIYTPFISPSAIFTGFSSSENKPVYDNGLCISSKSVDTLHVMHALLDRKKYLYPFVEGVYNFYYGSHSRFGIDFGDWIKSSFTTGTFKILGADIGQNLLFYKPLSGPLGYVFVDYLVNKRHMTREEIFTMLFTLTPEERKIIDNEGDMEVFYRKHIGRFFNTPMDSILKSLAEFINSRYNDITRRKDTVKFIRDKKRNVTFVISSLYKNGRSVSKEVSAWIDSIDFFHKPYFTFLFVPLWLADSFKSIVTPANSYWVPAYEFKSEMGIVTEVKKEYATFMVSDFIRTYSLQEKQLPLWFSLGIPMYLMCRDSCAVDIGSILALSKSNVVSFYANPVKTLLPSRAIALSYLMVRLTDRLHKNSVLSLLEKSMTNLDFSKTYKEVTGNNIRELLDSWKVLVEDTLFFRVSRK